MSKKNHNNLRCGFTEDLVSYLYDEINSAKKAEFERHLDNCSGCGEELIAFGFVRSSINYWHTEEFSELKLPNIEIPYIKNQNLVTISAVSNENQTWSDRFRRLFSFSPPRTTATAAFAVVAVFISLALFVLILPTSNDVANLNNDEKLNQINNLTETPVQINNNETVKSEENLLDKTPNLPDSIEKNRFEKKSEMIDKKSVLQHKKTESVSTKSSKSIKNFSETKKPNETITANRNLKTNNRNLPVESNTEIPKLTNFTDDEDDSLRLADLFDEIGSR